ASRKESGIAQEGFSVAGGKIGRERIEVHSAERKLSNLHCTRDIVLYRRGRMNESAAGLELRCGRKLQVFERGVLRQHPIKGFWHQRTGELEIQDAVLPMSGKIQRSPRGAHLQSFDTHNLLLVIGFGFKAIDAPIGREDWPGTQR